MVSIQKTEIIQIVRGKNIAVVESEMVIPMIKRAFLLYEMHIAYTENYLSAQLLSIPRIDGYMLHNIAPEDWEQVLAIIHTKKPTIVAKRSMDKDTPSHQRMYESFYLYSNVEIIEKMQQVLAPIFFARLFAKQIRK